MIGLMEKAVLRTLVYHNLFDYALTSEEIWRLLIVNEKRKTQNAKLQRKAQNYLVKVKRIERKNGFYFLKGRERIIRVRKRREKFSRRKIEIAKKVVKWLGLIPTIKMIGVTGAVAVGNAKKNDDIDLLLVTASERLWLTRILAVLFIEVLGKRRRPTDKKVADKICLNIFLDENHLEMPKEKQNLFVAHEIVQMKPLFDRGGIYERFLRENKWVKKHLVNAFESQKSKVKMQNHKSIYSLYFLLLYLLELLEKFAYRLQLKHMRSKMTKEQVGLHFAFFHPQDVSGRVLKDYKEKLIVLNGLR